MISWIIVVIVLIIATKVSSQLSQVVKWGPNLINHHKIPSSLSGQWGPTTSCHVSSPCEDFGNDLVEYISTSFLYSGLVFMGPYTSLSDFRNTGPYLAQAWHGLQVPGLVLCPGLKLCGHWRVRFSLTTTFRPWNNGPSPLGSWAAYWLSDYPMAELANGRSGLNVLWMV